MNRLTSALNWLDRNGVNTSRSRFARYLKLLTQESIAEQGSDRLFNAILEANEVCDIHEGFAGVLLDRAYSEKLKEYCAGPEEYLREPSRKNNHSRDIGFELAIASQFARFGLDVNTSLDDIDVAATHGGYRWLIECKRPRFDHSVRGNVKGAYRQLRRRSEAMLDPHYGLVAVSFTRVVMQESLLGVDATHDVAEEVATSLMTRIVKTFGPKLKAISSRPSIVIGLLFRLILPYWDAENHEKGTYTLYGSVSFHSDGSKEIDSFRELTSAISEGDVPILKYGGNSS